MPKKLIVWLFLCVTKTKLPTKQKYMRFFLPLGFFGFVSQNVVFALVIWFFIHCTQDWRGSNVYWHWECEIEEKSILFFLLSTSKCSCIPKQQRKSNAKKRLWHHHRHRRQNHYFCLQHFGLVELRKKNTGILAWNHFSIYFM